MNSFLYPFSAIVGQDAMKTALLLNAVDPTIGGVLIRGHKGTAKSTAARALAALLPEIEVVRGCPYHCPADHPEHMHDDCLERFNRGEALAVDRVATPLVELPLGATEDRVVGSLQLEDTLKTGQRQFEPGLLAAANRGILYVDEVNLLEDHLVDLLLDAAASGVNRVEREGFCVTYPSRFMLVGTMNPEEGELRPQFLDRFGLVVTVEGLDEPRQRRQLVAERLSYEQNPRAFCLEHKAEEDFLSRRIVSARQHLTTIDVPQEALDLVTRLALTFKVQGHRADIILLKAARAYAALMDKSRVDLIDIRRLAWLVFPHRLPGGLLMDAAQVEKTLQAGLEGHATSPRTDCDHEFEADDYCHDFEFPGSAAAGSMLFETFKKKLQNA